MACSVPKVPAAQQPPEENRGKARHEEVLKTVKTHLDSMHRENQTSISCLADVRWTRGDLRVGEREKRELVDFGRACEKDNIRVSSTFTLSTVTVDA